MIIFQHGRADWVDPRYPVNGPAFNWATIEWVVLHYTAAINLIDGDLGEFKEQLPAYLRAIHRDYLNRQPNGYSIGYNAAVDWLGGTWELRGDTFKCAANANPSKPGDENAKTFAILMLVDGQDGATPLAAAAVRGLVAQVREQAPKAVVVLGHRDVAATQCPGTGVYAQIKAGVFEPDVVIPPPPVPEPPPPTPIPQPQPPLAPTPNTDDEEPTMWLIGRTSDTGDRFLASPRPRGGAYHVPSEVPNEYPFKASGGEAFDVGSGKAVTSWGACVKVPQAQLLAVMGAEV